MTAPVLLQQKGAVAG